MALNSAYYKTIGDTLYYATCNRDLKTPDLWWTRPTSFGGLPNEDFITTRTRGSWEVHEYARGNLLRAADEQCRGRQKKSKDYALLPGWGFSSRLWGKVTANYPPAGRDRLESLTKYDHVSTGLNTYRQKKMKEVHLENMKITLEASIPRSLALETRSTWRRVCYELPNEWRWKKKKIIREQLRLGSRVKEGMT